MTMSELTPFHLHTNAAMADVERALPDQAPGPLTHPRPRATECPPVPLLVVVTGPGDVARGLLDAAGRAATEARPLVVSLVRESAPGTMNPILQALAARRRDKDIASLARAARAMCGLVGVEVTRTTIVDKPLRPTRRGRDRALRRRLQVLADTLGAELHLDSGGAGGGGHR